MITDVSKLLMRLASCVRLDKEDPTNLRIEIDSVISYLAEYQVFVPNTEFTKLVDKMLQKNIVDKVPADINPTYLKNQIAKSLLELASNVIAKSEDSAIRGHTADQTILKDLKRKANLKGRTTI